MAATSAPKTGINSGGYRNTGTYGSPTWSEMTLIRDVSPAMPWDMGDASSRATRAKLYTKTQCDIGYQVVMRADDADAAYQAMYDASVSPTAVVDLMLLDGDITTEGAMGVRAEFNVIFVSQTQGAGDVVYTTFELKPAPSNNGVPKSVKMGAASAPTFTAF